MEFFLPVLSLNDTEIVRRNLNPSVANLLALVRALYLYYVPFLVVCGLASNLLSAILFSTIRPRKQSYAHYFIGLVISDSFFLLSLFYVWIKHYRGLGGGISGFWCQAVTYVNSIAGFLSVWMVVAISVDRLLYVCLPYRRSVLGTLHRARIVILGLLCLAVPVFLNLSILAGVAETEFGQMCLRLVTYESSIEIFVFIDAIINFFIPHFTIIVVNLITGAVILKSRIIAQREDDVRVYFDTSDLRDEDQSIAHQQHRISDDISQTISAIIFGLLFLALTFPAQALQLTVTTSGRHRKLYSSDVATYAVYQLLLVLWYTRLGTTFLVQFACNRLFRRQFFALFRNRKSNIAIVPDETSLENLVDDAIDSRAILITTPL